MAKYARRLNQIPKLRATIQSMCVGVYAHWTESLCVCVRACVHAFDASPGQLDQTPWPRSTSRLHYRWAEEEEKNSARSPFLTSQRALSLMGGPGLFTGAKIQDSLILPDVCPDQTAHLASSIRSP